MGGGLLREKVGQSPSLGQVEFDLAPARGRSPRRVVQSLRAARVLLRAPYRPDKKLAPVEVTAILAREDNPPAGEDPIEWLLLSNLPVESFEDAHEKVQWYLCRWQIEVFFRILKSGCKVEQLQLQSRERIEVALALYLIVAWRVLYLTRLGRTVPDLCCEVAFSAQEWQAVYLVSKRQKPPQQPPRLLEMLTLVACLGGYLARKGDGPPGPKTIWIGLQRTRDFVLALEAREASEGVWEVMSEPSRPSISRIMASRIMVSLVSVRDFVVLAQPAIAPEPCKGPLNNPAMRKKLRIPWLYLTALRSPKPTYPSPSPAQATARHSLHPPIPFSVVETVRQILQNQLGSITILNIGRMNCAVQKQTQGVHNDVTLAALHFLAGVVAARAPFSVVFTLWLSMIAALGLFLRPSRLRTRSRRVSWTFSQVPSFFHCLKYI